MFRLHDDLASGVWRPNPYVSFFVKDPKLRKIHKANVRDRILYQAIYRALYGIFDKRFIHDSYASRKWKGTHKGVDRFEEFARKVTTNHTKTAYALKCDIRKFFDNIDHEILLSLISERVADDRLIRLVFQIIESFRTSYGIGLPLGNVTSQICSNICLNELDQYAKHELKAKHYIRYCDDFVILHPSREFLEQCIPKIGSFLRDRLKLELHPNKVSIRKIRNGVDFLGFVSLPHYRVMRTKTKRRMMRKIEELVIKLQKGLVPEEYFNQVLASYKGMMKHCSSERLKEQVSVTVHGG